MWNSIVGHTCVILAAVHTSIRHMIQDMIANPGVINPVSSLAACSHVPTTYCNGPLCVKTCHAGCWHSRCMLPYHRGLCCKSSLAGLLTRVSTRYICRHIIRTAPAVHPELIGPQKQQAYRKGAINNKEEAQDEEAGSASMIGLQLSQSVPNGGFIAVVQAWISN